MLKRLNPFRDAYAATSVAMIVLAIGMGVSLQIDLVRQRDARRHTLSELRQVADESRDALERRFLSYGQIVRAARGLIHTDEEVLREEWAKFAREMGVGDEHSGTYGLALVRVVPDEHLEEYEKKIREQGVHGFEVRSVDGSPVDRSLETHFVIENHVPEEINRRTWGLDVASVPVNRRAYQTACDTGQPCLTSAFKLAQQGEGEMGVVLVLPVYRGGDVPSTVEGRRQSIDTFVALPIALDPLVTELAEMHRDECHLRFEGISDDGTWTTIYERPGHQCRPGELSATANPILPGQRWSIVAIECQDPPASLLARIDPGLLAGCLISSLLSTLVWFGTRTRRRAEALADRMTRSLRESEARYRALVDSAPVCIKEVDREGRIVSMNPCGLNMIEASDESEIVGKALDELVLPEDHEIVHRETLLVLEGQTRSFQFRLGLRSGRVVIMETLVVPRHDERGAVHSMLCVTQDVTERVRTESRIRENEARLSSLTRLAPVGIYRADTTGRLVDVSERAMELTGMTHDQMCAEDWSPFIHPDDYRTVLEAWTRLIEHQTPYDVEYRLRRDDGTWAWLHAQAVPERDAHGVVTGFVGSMADHTERRAFEDRLRRSEAQMRELAAQAQAANRVKSEFLANMSHEIRTPMTAILGFAELLTPTLQSDPEGFDALQTIHRNGEHLLQIINDVLDLSKIESGHLSIVRENLDLDEMIGQIFTLLRPRAGAKGLKLRHETAPDAPRVIAADPMRLRQILLNLVGNAIKFTETGEILVRSSAGPTPGSIVVEVIDTGVGIDPATGERLFEPFVQADSTSTRAQGGTGLGLSISRKLAEAMGGTLRLDAEHRGGSRFVLTLDHAEPIENGPAPLAMPREPERDRNQPTPSLRVLLAEDCPDNQRLIVHHLTHAGHDVVTADNGEIAVRLVEEAEREGRSFDLILMDMQMPKLDGYGAAARLRAHGYTGRIVALTAHAMEFDKHRCLDAGCDEYATKPIPRARLLELVSRPRRAA